MVDVAILGAGLDGLLAAHAVVKSGHHPVIFCDREWKYEVAGAQSRLLRQQIPGLTDLLEPVSLICAPSAQPPYDHDFLDEFGVAYFEKVFGDKFDNWASEYPLREFDDVLDIDDMPVWDAKAAYKKLAGLYSGHMQYQWITPQWYNKSGVRHDFDLVINTLNASAWCNKGHDFTAIHFYTFNEPPFGPMRENQVLLEPDPEIPHYLQAKLFGNWIVEWPENRRPPYISPSQLQIRPLGTNCDCDKTYDFIPLGAKACWDHRFFTHDSYYGTLLAMSAKLNEPKQLDLGV